MKLEINENMAPVFPLPLLCLRMGLSSSICLERLIFVETKMPVWAADDYLDIHSLNLKAISQFDIQWKW